VSTWRVSPYLAHRFGSTASSELRYTRDSVSPGNAGLGDSTSDTASLSVSSGAAFRTLGWGLQLSRQEVEDSRAGNSTNQAASASLRYRVTNSLSLNLNGGYDKYDYQALGGATAGSSHSVGFTWTPSARTSLQASAGKRYFGSVFARRAAAAAARCGASTTTTPSPPPAPSS
jgi:uncharacterized protein (PEP-CTERM system associated)